MGQTQQTLQPSGSSRSYVLGCAVVAALGGLLFGFDTAVDSGAEQTLQKLYQPVVGLSDSAKGGRPGCTECSDTGQSDLGWSRCTTTDEERTISTSRPTVRNRPVGSGTPVAGGNNA